MLDQIIRHRDQTARAIDNRFSDRRHAHRMAVTLDKGRVEQSLELLDAPRERRLRDMAGRGRLREIERLGDGDQIGELSKRR